MAGNKKRPNQQKSQFGIIVLADNYSISLRDMGFEGGGMMVKFLLRLPLELRKAINVRAKEMGLSANALILKVLWDYMGE